MDYARYKYHSHGQNGQYAMDDPIKKSIATSTTTTTTNNDRHFGTEIPHNVLGNKLNNQPYRNAVNHARKRKFHEVNEQCEQKEKEESFDRPAKKFRYNLRSRKEGDRASRTVSEEVMGGGGGPIRSGTYHPKMHVDSDDCDEDVDLADNTYQQAKQYKAKAVLAQQPNVRRSMRLKNKRIRKMALETRTVRAPKTIIPPKPKEPVYIVEEEMMECDTINTDDDLHVSDYVREIMEWYDQCEIDALKLIKKDYISSSFQPDLNESMRVILLNWLYNVHRRFKLLDRTFFLGVYIFDSYLSLHLCARGQLQMVGCVCLWIASKYHEIYAPEANDFAYIADHSFNVDQIFKCELSILCELKFRFADIVTPYQFSQRYLQVAVYPICKKYKDRGTAKALADGQRYCDLVESLTKFFVELALFDCSTVSIEKPSKIAAASLCFAVLSISLYPQWPDFLMRYTKYDYKDLKPILIRLNELRELTNGQLKTLRKKHSTVKKWLDRLNIEAVINNKYDLKKI